MSQNDSPSPGSEQERVIQLLRAEPHPEIPAQVSADVLAALAVEQQRRTFAQNPVVLELAGQRTKGRYATAAASVAAVGLVGAGFWTLANQPESPAKGACTPDAMQVTASGHNYSTSAYWADSADLRATDCHSASADAAKGSFRQFDSSVQPEAAGLAQVAPTNVDWACLESMRHGRQHVAVDAGYWHGKSAYIVVSHKPEHVIVVTCNQGEPTIQAQRAVPSSNR